MVKRNSNNSPDLKKPIVAIETASGIYNVKRPSGKLGAIHMELISKALPTGVDDDGKAIVSPADNIRFTESFKEWAEKVLPSLIMEGSVFTYDDMPGDDQFAVFVAMFNTMNLSGELFRFVN